MIVDVKLKDDCLELISDDQGWKCFLLIDKLEKPFFKINLLDSYNVIIDSERFNFSKEAFLKLQKETQKYYKMKKVLGIMADNPLLSVKDSLDKYNQLIELLDD